MPFSRERQGDSTSDPSCSVSDCDESKTSSPSACSCEPPPSSHGKYSYSVRPPNAALSSMQTSAFPLRRLGHGATWRRYARAELRSHSKLASIVERSVSITLSRRRTTVDLGAGGALKYRLKVRRCRQQQGPASSSSVSRRVSWAAAFSIRKVMRSSRQSTWLRVWPMKRCSRAPWPRGRSALCWSWSPRLAKSR
jgi:hypothetical protein